MGVIHKLDPTVVTKIAAGQVVERPAYAVKELIENAIDAHADSIKIEIEKSGLKKITVSDNGMGMSAEDIELAVEHHTTSKMKSVEDLFRISSLGFRGEALASIAAVSDMFIRSRTKDTAVGNELIVIAGKKQPLKPVGMAVGTTIIVNNLYYTVPVRSAFTQKSPIELRFILYIVSTIALLFPAIHFTLTHNRKVLLDISKHSSIQERTQFLLGDISNYVPLSFQESYIAIQGYVSKPQLTTTSWHKSRIFVNNRAVTNKDIYKKIKKTYGTLLNPHSYPIVILYITLPVHTVDVNIHPRKEEVRFTDQELLHKTIKDAVTQTLLNNNVSLFDMRWKPSEHIQKPFRHSGLTDTYAAQTLKQKVLAPKERQKNLSILGQISNTFVICSWGDDVLLVDQHAAHERVLYEQFMETFIKEKKTSFKLSKPYSLSLTPEEEEMVEMYKKKLAEWGFEIEKNNGYSVTNIPEIFKDRSIDSLLQEMLDDMVAGEVKTVDRESEKMISFLACRSAVKAGDEVSTDQIKTIIEDLFVTNNPHTCPHGRPTHIMISSEELQHIFKRL